MKIRSFLLAMMLCALCVTQASALEYTFDAPEDYLFGQPTEYENIDELNHLAHLLSGMDSDALAKLETVMDSGEYTGNVKDLINLTQNLDNYRKSTISRISSVYFNSHKWLCQFCRPTIRYKPPYYCIS